MTAGEETVSTGKKWKKSTLRDYYETLLITMIILNFARVFAFQTFKIPTGSMIDNLLIGDHLVVNKFVYGNAGSGPLADLFPFREIRRGDIVVFRFPLSPDMDYVKRVVGLPGEVVSIRDKQVFVNGEPIEEPYKIHQDPMIYPSVPGIDEQYRRRDHMPAYTVPPGQYFVMGDNRDLSYDSRYWGSVPREYIKGRPFLVYWSFRSDEETGEPQAGGVARYVRVIRDFIPNTRWDRMGFIVDSKYHYEEKSAE